MQVIPVSQCAPAPRTLRASSSRARIPGLHSDARPLAVRWSAQQLSTSPSATQLGRMNKQGNLKPVARDTSMASSDSTWWSDPHSGERRRVQLSKFRTLMLDNSYRPIAVVNWQRAVSMDWMRKVDVLEYWQGVSVASASSNFDLPAVMCVRGYVQRPRKQNGCVISRRNILIRDQYQCQYCRSKENLTIDHVLPASKGGKFTWSNCVTACRDCNAKKGSKTLAQIGWVPIKKPRELAVALKEGGGVQEPSHHELAPLRLMLGNQRFEDVEPWKTYLMPWIKKSRASLSKAL